MSVLHKCSFRSGSENAKSSSYISYPEQTKTCDEKHQRYLTENLKVNAALRDTVLGQLLNVDTRSVVVETNQDDGLPKSMSTLVTSISPTTQLKSLERAPSNPFGNEVTTQLLKMVNFPGTLTDGYTPLYTMPRLKASREVVEIGNDGYITLKYQNHSNCWEFYICREIQARLANNQFLNRFLNVTTGYFSDQDSILVSDYVRFGSLLDLANIVKQKSGKPMKEVLCVFFCLEMLRIVEALHAARIIHADIKPDNFLMKLHADNVSLELINFGSSIDMSLFPAGTSFTKKINAESFTCCEMRDGRPWNYHTDMFCIAATGHVLLFGKRMQLQKNDGYWSITYHLPRYVRTDLWKMFFSCLLNQQSAPAASQPLQDMFEESLKQHHDFVSEMRFIINILRNR